MTSLVRIFFHNKNYFLYFIGVTEFDNEIITIEAFCSLTNYKIDESLPEKENLNWKVAKPFILNEQPQEIFIRVSEKDVRK